MYISNPYVRILLSMVWDYLIWPLPLTSKQDERNIGSQVSPEHDLGVFEEVRPVELLPPTFHCVRIHHNACDVGVIVTHQSVYQREYTVCVLGFEATKIKANGKNTAVHPAADVSKAYTPITNLKELNKC